MSRSPPRLTEAQINLIRQLPLFHLLQPEQFSRLMVQSYPRRLHEGELLFQQDDPFKALFVTLSGHIKLFQLAPNGDEKIVDIIAAGESFAEAILFFRARRYPLHAIALKNSVVATVPAAEYEQILRGSVDLCFNLMGQMSQRIHWLVNEIEQLTLYNATSRLVGWLLAQPVTVADTYITLTLPKQVIASRLSIQPETLSRILKRLGEQGYLRVEESRLYLLNRPGLQSLLVSE